MTLLTAVLFEIALGIVALLAALSRELGKRPAQRLGECVLIRWGLLPVIGMVLVTSLAGIMVVVLVCASITDPNLAPSTRVIWGVLSVGILLALLTALFAMIRTLVLVAPEGIYFRRFTEVFIPYENIAHIHESEQDVLIDTRHGVRRRINKTMGGWQQGLEHSRRFREEASTAPSPSVGV